MSNNDPLQKRRQASRIKRDFIISFQEKKNPSAEPQISQLRNINSSGMCFTASCPYPVSTLLAIQVKVPYLNETIELAGTVVDCHPKVENVFYEVHVKFSQTDGRTESLLARMVQNFAPQENIVIERRKYKRINKNFVISYYSLQDPLNRHDVSQIKNIGLGGMCFVTSQYYRPATPMAIEIRTPFLEGTAHLEGTIIGSYEKIPHILYETRLAFDHPAPNTEFVLKRIMKYYREEGDPEDHGKN